MLLERVVSEESLSGVAHRPHCYLTKPIFCWDVLVRVLYVGGHVTGEERYERWEG